VRNVDAFLLYYRTLQDSEKQRRAPASLDPAHLTALADSDLRSAGFSHIRIHRFVPKRSQAVIRDLQSATNYVLILFAVNQLARSPPSVCFFQTAPADDIVYKRTISRQRPIGPSLCDRLAAFTARIICALLNVLLVSYVMISALFIVVYRDTVYNDLCYILNWAELYEVFCAVGQDEPSGAAPHVAQESASYFMWLYNVFSVE